MALVVTGLLNKQVASELGISEITVKAHRGNMMRKMSARSLPELVNMAAALRVHQRASKVGEHQLQSGWLPSLRAVVELSTDDVVQSPSAPASIHRPMASCQRF